MAMTTAMEDVLYDRKNFNYDPRVHRHPLYATERHFIYHLWQDENGYLRLVSTNDGKPIMSPRRLRDIAVHRIVTEPKLLARGGQREPLLPANVYQPLLTESILQRETEAVVSLVGGWPAGALRVKDVVPGEDTLDDDYLTRPFDGGSKTSLVDCFVLGLLKLRPGCRLRCVDFSGFEKDRKLCRELSRLPILWMKPEDRTVDKIHDYLSDTLDITKDKVQRFLNRISVVYGNVDGEFEHGNKIDQVTVFVDLQILIDDVPIGLSLQHKTPFRFSCSRLWMTPIKEVGLAPGTISVLIDYKRITHFEYRDALLPNDESRLSRLLSAIADLTNLFAVSLPSSVDVGVNERMASQLNGTLRKLPYLQRLNFSYCNLRGHLAAALEGLSQRLVYLNLTDCRLAGEDVAFLAGWRPLHYLRELDLSYNDLENVEQVVVAIVGRMPSIVCLSVACCSLGPHTLAAVARRAGQCAGIKVLRMHGYIPLPEADTAELLRLCAQIATLQKLLIFPQAYAFPGDNDHDREVNKLHALATSYRYLEMRKRFDIQLEE